MSKNKTAEASMSSIPYNSAGMIQPRGTKSNSSGAACCSRAIFRDKQSLREISPVAGKLFTFFQKRFFWERKGNILFYNTIGYIKRLEKKKRQEKKNRFFSSRGSKEKRGRAQGRDRTRACAVAHGLCARLLSSTHLLMVFHPSINFGWWRSLHKGTGHQNLHVSA